MTKTECDPMLPAPLWRTPRSLVAGGTLTLALALSACGGSGKSPQQNRPASGGSAGAAGVVTKPVPPASQSSAGTGAPTSHVGGDFCSLVSAGEAQAVLGEPVQPGVSHAGAGPAGLAGSCLYKVTKPDPQAPTVVNVIVLGTKIPRSIYDQELKHDPQGGDVKPLSGLGEDAFFLPGIVTVFDHGLVLSLEIIKGGRPVDTAAITQLLRKALGRAGHLG